MELSVGELAAVLQQSQPRVSRHVRILADAGLLRRFKEGAWVFVRLGDAALTAPVLALIETLCGGDTVTFGADRARLVEVRAERVAAATAYFAAHAEQWDDIRSLHVADDRVEAVMLAALADQPIGRLLDIGTGTGRIIELFGPHADGAIGIDRSPDMLRLARGKLEAAGLSACEVRQADMFALPRPDGSADTVVLHQVLHFAENPGAAIAEAARVLAPGGRLLVVDFARHAREELRARHAHARLGFDDAQVCDWLALNGLATQVVDHLGGGDGSLTVTLWLGQRGPAAATNTGRKEAA
ncbi:MAG: ArsR/SmtB family transcription factor, partial [Polymorphobacter sp.]